MKYALDLFCGGGGITKGLQNKGYTVTGIDNIPQKNYCGDSFILGDALEVLETLIKNKEIDKYEFIHASPPCQKYSKTTSQWKNTKTYVDLINPTRVLLKETGKPYSIENVTGSPLINPILLCGNSFELKTYRHRLFETSFLCEQPEHKKHVIKQVKMGRKVKEGDFMQVVGHFSNVNYARKVMGISWLGQKELAQAIPPIYMEYIISQFERRL